MVNDVLTAVPALAAGPSGVRVCDNRGDTRRRWAERRALSRGQMNNEKSSVLAAAAANTR